LVGLTEIAYRPLVSLSGGQMQRVASAGAASSIGLIFFCCWTKASFRISTGPNCGCACLTSARPSQADRHHRAFTTSPTTRPKRSCSGTHRGVRDGQAPAYRPPYEIITCRPNSSSANFTGATNDSLPGQRSSRSNGKIRPDGRFRRWTAC